MQTVHQECHIILARMTGLLRLGNLTDWADGLERLGYKMVGDPDATTVRILSLYGGMGSLNDLVLYKDGAVLSKENVELDDLRSRLYDLCHDKN